MPFASSSTEERSHALQTILSSLNGAGLVLKTLDPAIPFFKQSRPCEWCGEVFRPKTTADGLRRFCSRSCSAKWRMSQPEHLAKAHTPQAAARRGMKRSAWLNSDNPKAKAEVERIRLLNPTSDPKVRAKISRRLQEMNHGPSVRGGNGRGLTREQRLLADALGDSWQAEFALSLGRRKAGYPTHYKLDIANFSLKIAIDVDGNSHHSRRSQDAKKDAMLVSLGWKVLRFWNRDIRTWSDSGMPKESFISMTLNANGIHLSASTDA